MEPIGEKLAEARKRKGASLREASEATKIRSDYLVQMENGTFDFPLPAVYKRGFLKIYATYLDLDTANLNADYNAEFFGAATRPRREPAAAFGQPEPVAGGAPVAEAALPYDSGADENRTMIIRLAVMIGVVVLVVAVIYAGLQHLFSRSSSDSARAGAANSTIAGNMTSNTTARTPPTPPPAAMQLTFSAERGDVSTLVVRQLYGRRELYNGPVRLGQTVPVTSQGPVEISANPAQNLLITYNGRLMYPADGAGRRLSGQQPFYWPPGTMP